MLICLIGPPKSGKDSLATHLTRDHGFTRVHLASTSTSSASSSSSSLSFDSSSAFLDHVTRSWRRDFVTTDLVNRTQLTEFAKRPFVAIVAVDAPLGTRFKRAVRLAKEAGQPVPTLEAFVAADDELYHGSLSSSSMSNPPNASRDEVEVGIGMSNLSLDSGLAPTTPSKRRPVTLSPTSDAPPSPMPSPARLTPSHSPEMSRSSTAMTTTTTMPVDRRPRPVSRPDPLTTVLPLAVTTLQNPYSTLEPFYSLVSLPVLSDHLRPTWDTYFMALASLASLRSNCMKRRVGAVLVRDKRVVSTGYNGTPRGVTNCNEGGCARCNSNEDGWGPDRRRPGGDDAPGSADDVGVASGTNGRGETLNRVGQGLDACVCLHAEENALLEAGRDRVSGGGGKAGSAVLYCNTCPCLTCTVKIVQCGVKEVVYSLSYSMDSASRKVMESAGVVLRQMQGVPAPV
ncbi:hypothetical protein JCM10212_003345 [Sporobolomyces blumeae]